MKHVFEELESPWLYAEMLDFAVPASGVEAVALESPNFENPLSEAWTGEAFELDERSAFIYSEADSGPGITFESEGGLTGEDDRTEVGDTTIPPFRWVCSVSYEKDGQTLNGGSGFLISSRHVLTAGHVITEAEGGPNPPTIRIYPGRSYGKEPFGSYTVARSRVSKPLDYGLITLNRPVDPSVLWWGHPATKSLWWSEALLPQQQLLRTAIPISTAGFPGAKDRLRRRMFKADGFTMPGAFSQIFRHTADTTQGQSGSPIWTVRNGQHILVGIVTSYDQQPGQRATWIHAARTDIKKWMAEDAPKVPKVRRRPALEVPYRWICRLEVHDNTLKRVVGYGTGLLISDRHALTSARVIHNASSDPQRYSVRITPGYEFGEEAFGSTTASKARVSPKFSPENKDGSVDYGLLTLSRPIGSAVFSSIGNAALGNWGNQSHGLTTTPADWSGKAAHVGAFSRSSGGGGGYHKLRVATGSIVGLQRGQIVHKVSLKLDAPGAPIWVETGKGRLLVGIASSVFSRDSGSRWDAI